MNKLFNSPKQLLKYMLLFTATIVAVAVIFVCFFGFNKSYQYGDQYQITVDYVDLDKTNSYINNIKDVISDNSGSVTYTETGDKTYLNTLTIVFKANANDATIIKSAVVSMFDGEINADQISVERISNTYATKSLIKLILPVCLALVGLFIYGLLRRNYKYGFALMISFGATILVGLALFAITRTQISISSIGMLTGIALLSVVAFVYYTSISFMKKNSVHGEKERMVDLYVNSIKSSTTALMIPMGLIVLSCIALIFTFNPSLVQFGISGIVSVFAGVWSSIFLTGAFYFTIANDESSKQRNIKK